MTSVEQDRTTEHYASYSQLTTHRGCPQRWYYGSVQRLSKVDPDDVKVYLDFGNWWHAYRHADSIMRGRAHGSLKWLPKTLRTVDDGPEISTSHPAIKSAVMGAVIEWWETRTPYQVDTWRETLGWQSPEEGLRYIDEEYHKQWADDLEDERPLAVELSWRRVLPPVPMPVRLPDGTVDLSQMVDADTVLIGYVDEVFFDVKRNLVVVRDHKAHKALGTQTTADDMMDSQLQLYAWGANSEVLKWGHGPIRATAYDRVRSVAPRPPILTTSGKLATRNGEPSISASDLRTYLEWSAGPDGEGLPWQGAMLPQTAAEKAAEKAGKPQPRRYKEGGVYVAEPSVVEALSSPKARSIWFQRTRTPLNPNVVRTHLRAAADSALDMVNSKVRAEVSGEAARNMSTSNCRFCDYVGLCRSQLIGGSDGDYELADFRLRVRD